MFATRGNCTVSLSVVTVPACYPRYFEIRFLDFVLFLCFISVLLSLKREDIVRFSWFWGSLFVFKLFSVFGVAYVVCCFVD